jgi:hypothetical protein
MTLLCGRVGAAILAQGCKKRFVLVATTASIKDIVD